MTHITRESSNGDSIVIKSALIVNEGLIKESDLRFKEHKEGQTTFLFEITVACP